MRQEQILDTTLEIIAEKGVGGVSTSEIAQRVGIVPSALYRHFDSKEALIDALIDRTHKILFENVGKVLVGSSGASDDLRSLFLLHIEFIRRNPGIPKLVFSDAAIFGSPERREKILSIVKKYMDKLANITERGRKKGELMDDVSSEAVAFSIISLVQHVGMIYSLSDGKMDMSNFAGLAWSYVERAIRKKNERDGR